MRYQPKINKLKTRDFFIDGSIKELTLHRDTRVFMMIYNTPTEVSLSYTCRGKGWLSFLTEKECIEYYKGE